MSECPYCQNTFEMTDTCSDEFRMWQGLVGPYYIPSVDESGVLSWTNTGGLPNPDPEDISGPPGKGLTIKGVVATVGDLPEDPEDGDTYLVGASDPYDGYIWLNGTWVELGDISKGETGEGVPTGGTTGQVLAKASSADYDTEWKTPVPGVDPATAAPLMDGTAAVGTSTKYAREDHVHPVYNQIVRPNLLDNWYFVGGGSQLGNGVFPINQRGQLSYSGSVYGIDRWRAWVVGTSVTVNSGSITLSTGSSSDGLFQYFENIGRFHNKTLTVSALINGNLFTATGTSTTTTWISVNIDNDGSYLAFVLTASEASVRISLAANKTVTVTAIKLELGTTQTLAHQENGVWVLNEIPNFADELARCQRYFQRISPTGACPIAFGVGASTNLVRSCINLPVTMRTSPTVSATGSFVANAQGASVGVSSDAVAVFTGNILALYFKNTGNIVTDQFYIIQAVNGGTLDISADL